MDGSCLLFLSSPFLSLFNPFMGDSRCADRVRELTIQKSFTVNTAQLCTDYGLSFSLSPLEAFEAEFIPTTAQLCRSVHGNNSLCTQSALILFFQYGCKINIISRGESLLEVCLVIAKVCAKLNYAERTNLCN